MRPARRRDATSERTALGLLGDLVDHAERDLHARTGVVLERGSLGTWLVGESGALLVRRAGGAWTAGASACPIPELPSADRIAHLLLALRTDEQGFATVANLAFSGSRRAACGRACGPQMRPALDTAAGRARPSVQRRPC